MIYIFEGSDLSEQEKRPLKIPSMGGEHIIKCFEIWEQTNRKLII